MASNVKEKIKVGELTKYGFKVGNEYVNYSKQLSEADKAQVVPGIEFEADLYVADSGKRYLNKVLSAANITSPKVADHVQTEKSAPVDTERAKKFVPKFQKKEAASGASMSKEEWQAKDRSQLIGGLSHDAATITAALAGGLAVDAGTTEVLKVYKSLLEGMLQIRSEVK